MERDTLITYIAETYNADIEYLWESTPDAGVFRHRGNRKWFGLIMTVGRDKFGLTGGNVDILNLKADPLMHGSLCTEEGIFPAYHMNKQQWISVLLDGSVSDDMIKGLINMSFDLTDTKPKRRKQ